MSSLFKRILSIALALMLVLSNVPVGKVFAEENVQTEIKARYYVALSEDMGNRSVGNYEFLFNGKVIYGNNPIGSDIEGSFSGYTFINDSGDEVNHAWFTDYINKKSKITFNGETFDPKDKVVQATIYRITNTQNGGTVVNVDIKLEVKEKKLSERTKVLPKAHYQKWGVSPDFANIEKQYTSGENGDKIERIEFLDFDNKSNIPDTEGDDYTKGYYNFKIHFTDGSVSEVLKGKLGLLGHLANSIIPEIKSPFVLLKSDLRFESLFNIESYKVSMGPEVGSDGVSELANATINGSSKYSPKVEFEEAPDTAVAGKNSFKLKITYPDNTSGIYDGTVLVFNPRPIVFTANKDLPISVDKQINDDVYLQTMKKASLEEAVKEVGLDLEPVGFEIKEIDQENKKVHVEIRYENDTLVYVYDLKILSREPQSELITPQTKELIVRPKEKVTVDQVFDMDAYKEAMNKKGYPADDATLNGDVAKNSPKVEFVKEPDTTNGGIKEYTLKITYPDSSSEVFNGIVKVFVPRSIIYQVKKGQTELEEKDRQRLMKLTLEEALKEI
ncbi:MAG: Rib/alpha-like domain-containing protein, partial [Bacillota bacterium]|nr:Rib/alpha-like domain-containing protein [Bacillota bacterium]